MSAPPCVSFRGKKNGRRKADLSPAAAIYAAQAEAVQPPDDRTYSAEVTVFRRNLLHHRSARAECPYTCSIMIPCFPLFVKHFFANFFRFLVLARCSSLPVRTPFPSPGGKRFGLLRNAPAGAVGGEGAAPKSTHRPPNKPMSLRASSQTGVAISRHSSTNSPKTCVNRKIVRRRLPRRSFRPPRNDMEIR